MDLLFDFDRDGIEELRDFVPGLYASINYEEIKPFVETATYELIDLTGQSLMDALTNRYLQNVSPSTPEEEKNLNELVTLAQGIIARSALLQYAPLMDLKNDGNGRRMHVDESSKAPWEWMVNAADDALFQQWQNAINRFFIRLDALALSQWTSSDHYKQRQALLCNYADVDPISKSYWFFSRTFSFNQDAQDDLLLSVMGPADYEALQTARKGPDPLSDYHQAIENRAKKAIRHLIMIRALQELPVEILPQGVVQRYRSDRAGQRSSASATEGMVDRALGYHRQEAEKETARLREIVRAERLKTQEDPSPITDCTTDKFFMP